MAWIQLRIHATKQTAEAIAEQLEELACPCVTFLDGSNQPVYEPKPGEVILWPETIVIGLFEAHIT